MIRQNDKRLRRSLKIVDQQAKLLDVMSFQQNMRNINYICVRLYCHLGLPLF